MNEYRLPVEVEEITNLGNAVERDDVTAAATVWVYEDDPKRHQLLEDNRA